METKRFAKNDSGFICQNCGKQVLPLGISSRNHCPFCLCSLHVDNMPGDRQNPCGGIMDAVFAKPDPKREYILYHKCRQCGEVKRNRAVCNAPVQPDDVEKIIKLTVAGEPC